MSFSPRNLTSVSVVSRYARRDVTFACPAMRKWQHGSVKTGAKQPERFLRKQVCHCRRSLVGQSSVDRRSIVARSSLDRLVISILRLDRCVVVLSAFPSHSRIIREMRSLGVSLAYFRHHRRRRDVQQRSACPRFIITTPFSVLHPDRPYSNILAIRNHR